MTWYWGILAVYLVIILLLLPVMVIFARELLYRRALINWDQERFVLIQAVFSEAYIIRSVPDHSKDLQRQGTEVVAVRGLDRNVLNFTTLKEMLWLMLDMESERRAAVNRMAKSIDALAEWEINHPHPKAPTYFGREIPLAV